MHEQSRLSPEVISTPFRNSSEIQETPGKRAIFTFVAQDQAANLLGAKICYSLPQFIRDTESLSRIKKIIFNNIFNSHSTAQMSVTSCVAFHAQRESCSALCDSCSVRIIEA